MEHRKSVPGIFSFGRKIKETRKPVVVLVNKIDKISDQEIEEKKVEIVEKLGEDLKVVFASGMYSFGLTRLLEALENVRGRGIQYYPEDMYTDMSVYRMVTEIVREKILERQEMKFLIRLPLKFKCYGAKKQRISLISISMWRELPKEF